MNWETTHTYSFYIIKFKQPREDLPVRMFDFVRSRLRNLLKDQGITNYVEGADAKGIFFAFTNSSDAVLAKLMFERE